MPGRLNNSQTTLRGTKSNGVDRKPRHVSKQSKEDKQKKDDTKNGGGGQSGNTVSQICKIKTEETVYMYYSKPNYNYC